MHVVLKATSEHGRRLNIKKAHLKEWRVKFTDHLRELGVAANATPRMFRGSAERPIALALYWRDSRENATRPGATREPAAPKVRSKEHEARTR